MSDRLEFLLALDNSKFNRALKTSQTKVTVAGKKMAAGVQPAIAGFKKLAKGAGKVGIAVGIAAAATGMYALSSLMRESIQLANEQEAAEAKLEAVVRATGESAGMSAGAMKQYASDLQSVTTYGDEVTISAMAILATFKNIKGDEFKRATRAAQDMATVMGTDLNSSITQVGKALNDPIKGVGALSRVGVQFTEQQKEQIKTLVESGKKLEAQGIILKELEGQFGGAASASRSFFGGIAEAVSNAKGDLFEELGYSVTKNQFFIEGMKLAEQVMVSWTAKLKENDGVARKWAKDVGMSILSMADAAMVGIDWMYRGLNLITGAFKGAAAAALVTAGGIFKLQQAVAYLDDALGITTGGVEYYKEQAAAAFAAGGDLAQQSRKDFDEMAAGSTKIDAARTALEGLTGAMEKVGTEKIEDLAAPIEGATGAVAKHEQSVDELGGTWRKTWDEAIKSSDDFFDQAMKDLARLQTEAAKGVNIPMTTVQAKATGGLVHAASGFAVGGRVTGPRGIDKVPAWLTENEVVIQRPSVMAAGLKASLAFNAGNWPVVVDELTRRFAGKFQLGGRIPIPSLPALPKIGFTAAGQTSSQSLRPIVLPALYGGATVHADPVNVDKIIGAIDKARRTSERFGQ